MGKVVAGSAEALEQKLVGVRPELASVVRLAYSRSPHFGISEGVRLPARQEALVLSGASQTLNSRHLTGHAVDLFGIVGGVASYDWGLYYPLAALMQEAAEDLGVELVWGGVWDKNLADLLDPQEEVAEYILRRKAKGKKAFIDGPHFELSRRVYP